MQRHRIVYHTGGPAFHPVAQQARTIADWLGDEQYEHLIIDGAAAFDALERADLLVLMGLFWTGGEAYEPLSDARKNAVERYVASGRPIIAHHGAIASYDDWPRFGELVGFAWIWGKTNHSPIGDYNVRVLPTGHPIVAGVNDYSLHDELYYDIAITPGLEVTTHAVAAFDGKERPMIMTAGKVIYLANGHDMKAFECPAMPQIWQNAVAWAIQ